MLVIATDGLDPEGVAIDPAKTRDVIAGLDGNFHPRGLAPLALTTPTRTSGLASPGWDTLHVYLRVGRDPVGDRILRHVVVDFDECASNAVCMGIVPSVFEVATTATSTS